jgi:4-hydroxybenzoyl-CoA thioesterase
MPVTKIYPVNVEFGDCDPAQIAYFPNFFRWYDAASRNFFVACGVPLWRDLEKTTGIIGTPVIEISSRFVRPTTYGDALEVHSTIVEWNAKTFVMQHQLKHKDSGELVAEARDVRAFVIRHPDDPARIKAIPIPQDIKAMCS